MQTHLVLILDCFAEKTLAPWGGPGEDVRLSRRIVNKSAGGAHIVQKATLTIMREIGSLLTIFQADKDKVLFGGKLCFLGIQRLHIETESLRMLLQVGSLAKIVRCLKPELFILQNDAEGYDGILRKVSSLFFKHHGNDALGESMMTLVYAATYGPQELQVSTKAGFLMYNFHLT